MKKCIVLGSPGSGKTAFSVKLHKLTNLPLFHLDNIWWKPDKTHITRAEFDIALASILKQESWIIDGDYSRTCEVRIKNCDTIFLLDYDTALCIEGVKKRIGLKRDDIPFTDSELDPVLLERVRQYRKNTLPMVLELLQKYNDKILRIFHSREEADKWLENATDYLR